MAAPTYALRALVMRRTKLGETDAICTLLTSQGSQVRAVAKGARKPTSSFASRLEVFSVCDLLLVQGKSLGIVKEARLVSANVHLRGNLDALEAASPMCELLDRCTQDGLEDGRLFPLTCKALACLDGADPVRCRVVCAAHLLKACAILGFRPRFESCVVCDEPLDSCAVGGAVSFSYHEGGVVCPACGRRCETVALDAAVAHWAQALLYSTFEKIETLRPPDSVVLALIRFLQLWCRQHMGVPMKSLNFLLAVG